MSLTDPDSRNRCQVIIREGLEDPLGAIGHANGPSRFGERGGGDVNVPNTSRMRENHTHVNHQVGTHIVHVRHVMVGQPLSCSVFAELPSAGGFQWSDPRTSGCQSLNVAVVLGWHGLHWTGKATLGASLCGHHGARFGNVTTGQLVGSFQKYENG